VQTQLLHEPLAPLPVDARHYVPALQNKPGEFDALRHASPTVWERMTPMIHFVGQKNRRDPLTPGTIRNWLKKAESAVGPHPFYLDVIRLKPNFPVASAKGHVSVLEQIYAAARRRALRFVPVVWVGESTALHRKLVSDAALHDGCGVALRYRSRKVIQPVGMKLRDYLSTQLAEVGVEASQADLVVDLEHLDADTEVDVPELVRSLNEMLEVGPWRAVVLLGTSIPSMMSCIDEGTVGSLPRREWDLWSQLKQRDDLRRMPSFGDYAIQHPQPPKDTGGPGMRANVRYTTERDTLVARGEGPVLQEGREQYVDLCQQLVARPEFAGASYSWGDSIIAGCAAGNIPPGAQPLWRGAGTSHHLQHVTDQL
jgi:Beta protein